MQFRWRMASWRNGSRWGDAKAVTSCRSMSPGGSSGSQARAVQARFQELFEQQTLVHASCSCSLLLTRLRLCVAHVLRLQAVAPHKHGTWLSIPGAPCSAGHRDEAAGLENRMSSDRGWGSCRVPAPAQKPRGPCRRQRHGSSQQSRKEEQQQQQQQQAAGDPATDGSDGCSWTLRRSRVPPNGTADSRCSHGNSGRLRSQQQHPGDQCGVCGRAGPGPMHVACQSHQLPRENGLTPSRCEQHIAGPGSCSCSRHREVHGALQASEQREPGQAARTRHAPGQGPCPLTRACRLELPTAPSGAELPRAGLHSAPPAAGKWNESRRAPKCGLGETAQHWVHWETSSRTIAPSFTKTLLQLSSMTVIWSQLGNRPAAGKPSRPGPLAGGGTPRVLPLPHLQHVVCRADLAC